MTVVSDIFAFAVQNADYWTDLLSGEDYPAELTGEETTSLEAARAHIEALAVQLLHLTGSKLADKLGPEVLATPKFKGASTAKNRWIILPAPQGLDGKLYRIEFALDRSEDGLTIQLYSSLIVKKASLESLRKGLAERKVVHAIDDYYVYSPGISLSKDESIDSVASTAANRAAELLSGFGDTFLPQTPS